MPKLATKTKQRTGNIVAMVVGILLVFGVVAFSFAAVALQGEEVAFRSVPEPSSELIAQEIFDLNKKRIGDIRTEETVSSGGNFIVTKYCNDVRRNGKCKYIGKSTWHQTLVEREEKSTIRIGTKWEDKKGGDIVSYTYSYDLLNGDVDQKVLSSVSILAYEKGRLVANMNISGESLLESVLPNFEDGEGATEVILDFADLGRATYKVSGGVTHELLLLDESNFVDFLEGQFYQYRISPDIFVERMPINDASSKVLDAKEIEDLATIMGLPEKVLVGARVYNRAEMTSWFQPQFKLLQGTFPEKFINKAVEDRQYYTVTNRGEKIVGSEHIITQVDTANINGIDVERVRERRILRNVRNQFIVAVSTEVRDGQFFEASLEIRKGSTYKTLKITDPNLLSPIVIATLADTIERARIGEQLELLDIDLESNSPTYTIHSVTFNKSVTCVHSRGIDRPAKCE